MMKFLPVIAACLALSCTQTQVKNAENTVFTTEQVVCMSASLADGVLTGPAGDVAEQVKALCPGLDNLTQDVVAFVNQFTTSLPQMRAKIKAKQPLSEEKDGGS